MSYNHSNNKNIITIDGQFKSALIGSPIPSILHAEDGEFLLVSQSVMDSTGYKLEEIDTLDKWVSKVHPNRKEYNSKFIMNNFNKGVQLQGEEEIVIISNGEVKMWAFYNSNIGILQDGRKLIMTNCIDMTETRNRETLNKKLLDELSFTKILLHASLESPKGVVILSFDTNYNYIFFNTKHKETMKQVYNTNVEVGKSILDCITVDKDRKNEKVFYDLALSGISSQNIEKYGGTNNQYFETHYNPIFSSDNEIIGVSVVSTDVTERTREHQRVKESEEKYRLIYSSMSQGLAVHEVVVDEFGNANDYRYIEINDSYLKLFGYKKEDIIGKRIREIAPNIEQYWINNFVNVAITGEPQYFENYSQSIGKYLSTYAYSPRQGQFAVLISDITERKKREAEIEFLSYNDQLTGVHNRRYYDEQLLKLDVKDNLPLSLIMGDVNGLKLVNDSFGHLVGDELLIKVAKILKKACRTSDAVCRIGGDEFVIILPKTDQEDAKLVLDRIRELAQNEEVNSIEVSVSFGCGTKTKVDESIVTLFKNIEDEMYRKKLNEGASMRSKTIDLIMATLYEKNEREMHHSKRVGRLCELLSIELNLDRETVNQVKNAGLMHDIGKIGIDENILNKPKELTNSEWKIIKKHSEIGYRILSSLNEFSEIADYVLEHHEKWDGSGYPKGKKGEAISIQARIISIADAYDAMTRYRTYKNNLTKEEAIIELKKYAGIQFDPDIISVFIDKVLNSFED